jgi:CHAD domain-containing protein
MASPLGGARNLEVFAVGLSELAQHFPGEPGLPELCARFEACKEGAYRQARATVSSTDFHCGVIDAARWLAVGEWTNPGNGPVRSGLEQPIGKLAAAELTRRSAAVARASRKFDDLDSAALHKLRIQVKKLRYACEFFESLSEHRKRKKGYLASLVDFQASLGALNDLAVQGELVLALTRPPAKPHTDGDHCEFAAGFVRGQQMLRAGPLRKTAKKACARFLAARPFWEEASNP